MNISTRTGLVGFLLALSALPVSTATAATSPASLSTPLTDTTATVEARLSRLTEAIRQLEIQHPEEVTLPDEIQVALGFADGDRGGWSQIGGGGGGGRGWVNGSDGGGFVNRSPWGNGWADGGSSFLNRY